MRRTPVASVLLLTGGVLLLVGLPLQWSSVATADGTLSSTMRGIDYTGYDIITTVALGLLLIVAAFTVAGGLRWGRLLGAAIAVLACLWAALVVAAAANPSADGSLLAGVTVTVGAGAWLVASGAGVALLGAILTFRTRSAAVAVTGVASGV